MRQEKAAKEAAAAEATAAQRQAAERAAAREAAKAEAVAAWGCSVAPLLTPPRAYICPFGRPCGAGLRGASERIGALGHG